MTTSSPSSSTTTTSSTSSTSSGRPPADERSRLSAGSGAEAVAEVREGTCSGKFPGTFPAEKFHGTEKVPGTFAEKVLGMFPEKVLGTFSGREGGPPAGLPGTPTWGVPGKFPEVGPPTVPGKFPDVLGKFPGEPGTLPGVPGALPAVALTFPDAGTCAEVSNDMCRRNSRVTGENTRNGERGPELCKYSPQEVSGNVSGLYRPSSVLDFLVDYTCKFSPGSVVVRIVLRIFARKIRRSFPFDEGPS